MKSAPARPRGNRPKRGGDEGNGVSSQDCSLESNLMDLDVVESSIEVFHGGFFFNIKIFFFVFYGVLIYFFFCTISTFL